MPSYQFLAVARIQFRQRDIVYFGKQDIGGFSFLHDREPELRCKNVRKRQRSTVLTLIYW